MLTLIITLGSVVAIGIFVVAPLVHLLLHVAPGRTSDRRVAASPIRGEGLN